jgi:LCP family protein required for cell wall assembly
VNGQVSVRKIAPSGPPPLPFGLRAGRPPASASSRLLRAFLAFVSFAVLLISCGGWVVYSYFNGKIHQVALDLGTGRPDSKNDATNYLLVGTDSRLGTNGAYGHVDGERSDTTIIVHIAKDNKVTLLSIPRDTYVTIPSYTDAKGTLHRADKNKFNSAIADGGPSLLVRTVEALTKVRIDHYISMDLEGFKNITNAIGGVEVCILPSNNRIKIDGRISTNTHDPMSGFEGGPGTITVKGDQALAFVRQRYGLPNVDLDRIKRQQYFIGAVLRKIMQDGVLTSPVKLEGLLSTATSALTLDDKTDIADLRKLAGRLRGISSGSLATETLPTHPPTRAEGAINDRGELLIGGHPAAVQLYDQQDLEKIVAPLGGSAGANQPTSTSDAAVPSTVSVFNGSNVPGLAAKAVDGLTAHGFPATNSGNASTRDYVSTRILYGQGEQNAASSLKALIPGSKIAPATSVDGIQLIVGSSFTGVTEPPVAGPSAASTTPVATVGSEPTEGSAPAVPAPDMAVSPPGCVY